MSYLTTHQFAFEDAPKAYDIVVNRHEPFLGIVLKYDVTKEHKKVAISINKSVQTKQVNIAFIGAGSYAQGNLLPNLPSGDEVGRVMIMTNSGTTAKRVAEKFHFAQCTSNEKDILDNKEINTLFIATRHDTHARYVIDGLRAGKNVYVEKPICLNIDELSEIEQLCIEKQCGVMIGFKRRFSPFAKLLKSKLGNGKMSMIYRINAGAIPAGTWIQDLKVGGGRIIGEACHFIDFMTYMCGSLPCKVMASALPDSQGLNDTVNIIVEFKNGSTGVVAYYANGSKALAKEYLEVYSSGITGKIDDFTRCEICGKKVQKEKLSVQNKGQKEMLQVFFSSLKEGKLPISMNEIFSVTKATFAAMKSIQESGMPVKF